MPDTLDIIIERIETIQSKLVAFQHNGDTSLLERVLEDLEEAHDEIEEIIDEH
jgi:hypothetical protein